MERDAWLQREGFRIFRFWNNDVLKKLDGVLDRVVEALREPIPPSLTLPRKKGAFTPVFIG